MSEEKKDLTLDQKILMVQQEAPVMRKKEEGYNYKYFDINQMIAVLKPLFLSYGLTIMQPLTHIDGKPAIETIIRSKNEEFRSVVPLPTMISTKQGKQGTDPQDVGSAITYMRRYSLQSLFFLEAEDKDGKI
jgi:hypothetical protein